MKCPRCNATLEKELVRIEGAKQKVLSFQCPKCEYVDFEQESAKKVVGELKAKETPMKIKQRIVKLSKDRLGTYFNKNIVSSLNLKPGEDIFISVPDKKHIIITRE